MKRTLNSSLIFVLILLIVCAVALAFAFLPSKTAFADAPHKFLIESEDGTHWSLYFDSALLPTSATGNFFYAESPAPAEILKEAIDAHVSALSLSDSDYEIEFSLPTPNAYFVDGIDQNPYTELADSMIFANTNYIGYLCSATIDLEYRPRGVGEYQLFNAPETRPNPYRFGQNINKGEYELRIVAREEFEYYGKIYSTSKASEPIVCRITDSDFPEDSLNEVMERLGVISIEYGMSLADIAQYANSKTFDGSWTVWGGQDEDYIFPASENERTLYLNFQSSNNNYNIKEKVSVPLLVFKRQIDVYVETIEVLVGHPLITDISYDEVEASRDLVNGDTLESIGLTITPTGVDINTPGTYYFYATVTGNTSAGYKASDNYEPVTRNLETQHKLAGIYRVCSKGVMCRAEDWRYITVARDEGFIGLNVALERVEVQADSIGGLDVLAGYRVVVKDSGGNELSSLGDLTITLEEYAGDYAVAYLDGEEIRIVVLDESRTFVLPNNITAFVVLKKPPVAYGKTIEWNGGLTAISVLMILFVIGIWVVFAVYHLKRRLLK